MESFVFVFTLVCFGTYSGSLVLLGVVIEDEAGLCAESTKWWLGLVALVMLAFTGWGLHILIS